MQYSGLFWSAFVRALLSFRRDTGLSDTSDVKALEALGQLEAGALTEEALEESLIRLCPPEVSAKAGKSLIGYLDFNKMGNFAVLLTCAKNIQESLNFLLKHPHYFFSERQELKIQQNMDRVDITWRTHDAGVTEQFRCYFLFALFRHLAGRQFDFTRIAYPQNVNNSGFARLMGLSQADHSTVSQQICLSFEGSWLSHPSFYYSAQLQKILSATLTPQPTQPLKQRIRATFEQAKTPARIRLEWVAQQMGTSESVLRRQLRQDNIAFSALLKDFIHERSCQHLLGGERSENTASLLGFADRRSFERSFKEFSGISAGQVRQLGSRMRFQKGNTSLLHVIDNLPPLPDTIQSLLTIPDQHLTLAKVVELIEQDPIFHAHIMSRASKAIYGSAPATLEQAIGRNLGLGNIKSLSVVFSAQQLLTMQCRFPQLHKLTDSMLLSLRLFTTLYGFKDTSATEQEQQKQLLLFGMLSLLLIFHDECTFVEGTLSMWETSQDFHDFCLQVSKEYGICFYGATTLMLLRWGFRSTVNQQLWKLCQAGDQISLTPLQEQVLTCHEIAFTQIVQEQTASSLKERWGETLDEKQLSSVEKLLSRW